VTAQPEGKGDPYEFPPRAVLLIDDQKLPMEYYQRALLAKGFTPVLCDGPDCALQKVRSATNKPVAVVLDVMMPPGKSTGSRTDDGLTTGVLLYQDLKPYCEAIPILVLTNMTEPSILSLFRNDSCVVLSKLDYTPLRLANKLSELLDHPRPAQAQADR
jgi:CheY-like chemotaxis protein